MTRTYATPPGGLPPQSDRARDRAVFTPSYAVIPARCMSDIVTSLLPGWHGTRAWVLARPMTGFAETFAQLIVELALGGGSDAPEPDPGAQAGIFVVQGTPTLSLGRDTHPLTPGSYAWIAPGTDWSITNPGPGPATFHWIRKVWEPAPGLTPPDSFVTHDDAVAPVAMPDTGGTWATTRFVDPADIRHDMHVNIVTFQPGGAIPFAETHVMEHGLYMLQGRALYLLNTDWVEVEAGDFLWLRAFCPQACRASGTEPFRYLLYKDVNRHPRLRL
jgi:(S)-ureidoglycine aminohydrolase